MGVNGWYWPILLWSTRSPQVIPMSNQGWNHCCKLLPTFILCFLKEIAYCLALSQTWEWNTRTLSISRPQGAGVLPCRHFQIQISDSYEVQKHKVLVKMMGNFHIQISERFSQKKHSTRRIILEPFTHNWMFNGWLQKKKNGWLQNPKPNEFLSFRCVHYFTGFKFICLCAKFASIHLEWS